MVKRNPSGKSDAVRAHAAELFLDQYFPFHYEVGFTVERHLRDPRLSQHQSLILWIIHASGEQGSWIPRKDIERRLTGWFDVTNSAISKALRGMTSAPLKFITIQEHPRSGREKVVRLTAEGERVVKSMIDRGEHVIQRIVDEMNDREIEQGLHFLRNVSAIVSRFPDR